MANERGRLGNRCHLIDRRCSHPHDYLAHKHIHGRNEGLNVDPLRTSPSRRGTVDLTRSKVHYEAKKDDRRKRAGRLLRALRSCAYSVTHIAYCSRESLRAKICIYFEIFFSGLEMNVIGYTLKKSELYRCKMLRCFKCYN